MSMLVVEQKSGKRFIRAGRRITEIQIVLKGSVIMKTKNDEFVLQSGSVIGLAEVSAGVYLCDYIANEDTLLVTYAFNSVDDLNSIFEEQPKYIYAFLHACVVQCQNLLIRYRELLELDRAIYLFEMKQYGEFQKISKNLRIKEAFFSRASEIVSVELEQIISQWEIDYIRGLAEEPVGLMKKFYLPHKEISVGEMMSASSLMQRAIRDMQILVEYRNEKIKILLGNGKEEDMLSMWFSLAKQAAAKGADIIEIQKKVKEVQNFLLNNNLVNAAELVRFQEFWKFDFEEYVASGAKESKKIDLTILDSVNMDYLEYILVYAGYDEEKKEEVRSTIKEYREAVQKSNKEREDILVYRKVEELYFDIYEKAFFNTLDIDNDDISPIIKVFFRFGFLDPEAVNEENTNALIELSEKIDSMESNHIYTFYDWLKKIWKGEKCTSKNEFDLDYNASIRELRKANRISAEEEKLFQFDRERMVKFEIQNMFHSACKGTYGRGGTYSPVLNGSELLKAPASMFVSISKLEQAIEKIKKVDFRCFYREILFFDAQREGTRMVLQKEIFPDIILIPIVGKRAMMWQENVGPDRESPGRFLFPILTNFDVDEIMLDAVANYRWEICRKLQGGRWNDISERSLTSEYYDYLQFFKKNKELSTAAKEKLRTSLSHAKGSFREVFAGDYVNWIKYESKGNFRLNKVSREILSRYCPFPQDTRLKLMENPMFRATFSRYENLMMQEETKIRNAFKRYKDLGGEVTDEMMDTYHFYKM